MKQERMTGRYLVIFNLRFKETRIAPGFVLRVGLTGLASRSKPSAAQLVDDLTYTYTSGNRLDKVGDATANAGGFNDANTGATNDYSYDNHGNATTDLNKGISNITYNILGKPQTMTFTDGRTVTYTYDAAGQKLKMATTVGGTTTTTDYASGFVYTNSVLSYFGSPEGRVVAPPSGAGGFEYQYAIADHQGNTRVVFSSVTPTPDAPQATFEGDSNDKSNEYVNVNNIVSFNSAAHSGTKVVRMNQNYNVGPAKSMKVYPGDQVDMEVWSYYESTSGYGTSNNTASAMITMVAGAFGGVSGAGGESGMIYNGVNSAIGGFGLGSNPGDSEPSAFLNYILFDQNYKVMDMGWQRVPAGSFTKQNVSIPTVTVKEAGYIFVYLSYEDLSNNYVYFDDFKVTHTKSNIVQYNEYYPFGLQTANSWTRENATGNQFLYNEGSELNTTTGFYDLPFRNYDASLGRFFQVDPLAHQDHTLSPFVYAGNNPVMFSDPSGLVKDYATSWQNPDYVFAQQQAGMNAQIAASNAHLFDWNNDGGGGGYWSGGWKDFSSLPILDAKGNVIGWSFTGKAAQSFFNSYMNSEVVDMTLKASTPDYYKLAVEIGYYTYGSSDGGTTYTQGGWTTLAVNFIARKGLAQLQSQGGGLPIGMWVDPSTLKIKKIGAAWYGSAHINETIWYLNYPEGIYYVDLNTTVNFDFSARWGYKNKELAQYLVGKAMDLARVSVLETLRGDPRLSTSAANEEFKRVFQIYLTDFTFGAEVKSYEFKGVPTFEVGFQFFMPLRPKGNL